MNEATFESNNQVYLRAASNWVRLLLQSRIPLPGEKPKHWWSRRHTKQTCRVSDKDLALARQAMEEASQARPSPAFPGLVIKLGLSPFEAKMLLLTAIMETDSGIPHYIAAVHGDASRRYPTFELGMSLFNDDEPRWDELAPHCPLRALRLMEVHQSGCASLLTAPLRIDERIAGYIKGSNYLDERLSHVLTPLSPPPLLPDSQAAIARGLGGWLSVDTPSGIVQLTGTDSTSKRDVIAEAARQADRQVLAIAADAIPLQPDDIETFARLWERESKLLRLVLYVHGLEPPAVAIGEDRPITAPAHTRLVSGLQRMRGPVVIDTAQTIGGMTDVGVVAVEPPTETERRSLWEHLFAQQEIALPDLAVARLSGEFKLAASTIARAVHEAAAVVPAEASEDAEVKTQAVTGRAWNVCTRDVCSELNDLVQRIEPRATLDDVKLPPQEKAQLERLVQHAYHRSTVTSDFGFGARVSRGLGLAAMFCGESGVGKTLAAEAVANALSLALIRINFETLFSKWVGETAKNQLRIFTAAERGGAVLFIDECDALLGKRSEAKDAHDRYANIDLSDLLTRMESFTGVAILATNMKHALDPAFMRRIRFVIDFPFPGAAERKAIWQSVFPYDKYVGDLDYDRLARYALTGGSIFNIALAAAHSAAAEGPPARVEMPHVLDAIYWELRKLGRPVSQAEFLHTAPRPIQETQEALV